MKKQSLAILTLLFAVLFGTITTAFRSANTATLVSPAEAKGLNFFEGTFIPYQYV
jgi:hypothetical protein